MHGKRRLMGFAGGLPMHGKRRLMGFVGGLPMHGKRRLMRWADAWKTSVDGVCGGLPVHGERQYTVCAVNGRLRIMECAGESKDSENSSLGDCSCDRCATERVIYRRYIERTGVTMKRTADVRRRFSIDRGESSGLVLEC